jgi:hypothetical protein
MRIVTTLGAAALAALLPGCGGGEGGPPDARVDVPPVDAPPRPPCFDRVDQGDQSCHYTPEPVTPAQISLAEQQALAARFNPAMVYTSDAVWAVSFDLLLVHGAPLLRAEHDGRLNFSYAVDEATVTEVPGQPADLRGYDMSSLPAQAPSGRGYVYFLDWGGPSVTSTGPGYQDETWKDFWRDLQGSDPRAAPFGPHQYAHLFWLDRQEGLLAIQYFFYYPYDKFVNNHEGDWEHVNVVLRTWDGRDPTIVMAHFSLHGVQFGAAAEDLYRIAGDDGGDHVVVFVGGDACQDYVQSCWCGDTSGASFPWPGRYRIGSYWEDVAGDAARPGLAIHARDFTVELLPRLEDVDFTARPWLSWYGLPFLGGEATTAGNHNAVIATNNHRAPVGPGPAHDEYDVGIEELYEQVPVSGVLPFAVPTGWTLVNEPPASTFRDLPANTNCAPP